MALTPEEINKIRQASGLTPLASTTRNDASTSLIDRINANVPTTSTQKVIPQTGDTGLKGFATGFAKGGLEGAIGLASGLQSLGQGIIAAVDPTKTYADVKAMSGVPSLQGEQLKQIEEQLKAQSTAEKAGKVVEFGAELLSPLGAEKVGSTVLAKGKTILSKGEELLASILEKRASKIALGESEKAFSEALNIARPQMTPILEQQAFKEGRVGKQGLFSGAPVAPSAQEIKLAEAVQPLVEQGKISEKMLSKNPTEVSNVIKTEVSKLNQGVKTLLNEPKFNQPFNKLQLDNILNDAKSGNEILFGGDKAVETAYDTIINEFKKFVEKKNISGLFESRQAFDWFIKTKIPDVFKKNKLGILNPADNAKKNAVLDIRRAVNNYISDLLPENNPFKAMLKQEADLLTAADNISTKIKGITQKGKIGSFLETPKGKTVKKAVIGTGVAGGVLGGGSTLLGN